MQELKEEWKEINGYKISSYGVIIGKRGSPLSTKQDKHGYIPCHINLGHPYGITYGYHRVIAMVFIPNPENKPEVNHKDANKANNRVDNLEWATEQENMTHSSINRLHPKTRYCCIIDDECNIIKIFVSISQACAFLPNSRGGIRRCVNGNQDVCHDIKFRGYNQEEGTYIKSRFDDPNYKWKSTRGRKILCEQNGVIYNSQMQASRDLKLSQSRISDNLTKGIKFGEYTFVYVC